MQAYTGETYSEYCQIYPELLFLPCVTGFVVQENTFRQRKMSLPESNEEVVWTDVPHKRTKQRRWSRYAELLSRMGFVVSTDMRKDKTTPIETTTC
jgi:hypothetical protein